VRPRTGGWAVRFFLIGFCAAQISGLSAADTLLSRHKMSPGIYVWDGLNGGSELSQSVRTLDASGIHAVRLLLSPAATRAYSLPRLVCSDGHPQLTCLFESESYQRALSSKTLDVVMLTAYDFTSYAHQRFLDPEFVKANRQQIYDEYRQLAETIMKAFSGSGRVFIIGHWEGDNQVYCGSSYEFEVRDEKRWACLEEHPEIRMAGFTEWLKIRQEAIAEGRRRAIAAGATNVEIYHAVEFNTIFNLRKVSGATMRSKEFEGVLSAVIPSVHPDICSYSAWESVNRNRLVKDVQDIVKACAPAAVVIGEIGTKDKPDKRYPKMAADLATLKESVPLVFFWQAFEGAAAKDPGFGLFDKTGKPAHPRAVESILHLAQ
jgi:hypothetical protein